MRFTVTYSMEVEVAGSGLPRSVEASVRGSFDRVLDGTAVLRSERIVLGTSRRRLEIVQIGEDGEDGDQEAEAAPGT